MKYIAVLMLISAFANSEWVDFGTTDINHAHLEVVECTSSGFVVDITLPGFFNSPCTGNGIDFNAIGVPSLTPYAEAEGAPMLPKASFLAAVPDDPDISITVETLVEPVTIPGITPSPMQPIPQDNSYDPVPFSYLPEAYSQGGYPSETAVYEEMGTLRGVNIGRFNVLPFHWDATSGLLTISPKIRVTVDLGSSVTMDPRLLSRFFVNTYRTLVNAEVLGEPGMSISCSSNEPVRASGIRQARDITAADLLIIAGDDFVDSMMNTFIQAKMDQGYLTAIVAAGSWNQTEIKNYIQNAYDNWVLPPSFILFVGDHGDLISYSAPTGMYSDNRYVCMDGSSDYQADIFNGRFVTPSSQYPVVEAKVLKWQFDPLMDPDFWGNVLCAGYFQATSGTSTVAERWFCFTCETVRDTYIDIYGKTVQREYTKNTSAPPPYYYRNDLPSAGQQIPMDIVWDGDAAGILASINSGVFLVQHRDHGSVGGWGDPYFVTSHLSSLTNGEMTPMVMSVNCLTGQFSSNCFAENFFRMEGGAVGVLAATEVSYSYWNDYLCYGLYKSFNDEYTSPPALYTDPTGNYLTGQALMCAKIEMETSAPMCPYPTNRAETEWDLFHWFGDPTMDMRTEVPHDLYVDAPFTLPQGSTEATFHVGDGRGSVCNALVCISHDSLWASGLTDSTGLVTLTFDPIGGLNDITWMVTAHNALPAEGVINGVGIEGDPQTFFTYVGSPHPNPAAGLLTVPVSLASGGYFEITVYDTAGRAVARLYSGELEAGLHSITWDTGHVPQGVYMIHAADPAGSVTTRRIVVCR
ncbi:MAG: T9SS type A sorting domain-containing protein [Candidatus Fermentibacteraceae bacterium]|nr:T9SS type A sorting domain-containing protein [Candidatus Fermentibacteraceae bacterium]